MNHQIKIENEIIGNFTWILPDKISQKLDKQELDELGGAEVIKERITLYLQKLLMIHVIFLNIPSELIVDIREIYDHCEQKFKKMNSDQILNKLN